MPALARSTDPQTSFAAALSVDSTALEARVLLALGEIGAGTSEEIAAHLGLSLVTVSPRLRPLEARGAVVRDGRRANSSGRTATLWRLAR